MIQSSPKAPWNDAAFLRSISIIPPETETEMLCREFARAELIAAWDRERIDRSRAWLGGLLFSIFFYAGIWLWAAL